MTYRDYLILTAVSAAAALDDAVKTAISMEDELYGIEYLEQKLAVAKELLRVSPNPERVLPRPDGS